MEWDIESLLYKIFMFFMLIWLARIMYSEHKRDYRDRNEEEF